MYSSQASLYQDRYYGSSPIVSAQVVWFHELGIDDRILAVVVQSNVAYITFTHNSRKDRFVNNLVQRRVDLVHTIKIQFLQMTTKVVLLTQCSQNAIDVPASNQSGHSRTCILIQTTFLKSA